MRPGSGLGMTWDDLLDSYLGGFRTQTQLGASTTYGAVLNLSGLKVLLDPADKIAMNTANNPGNNVRRSYAIPRHNMGIATFSGVTPAASDWPPNPANHTGVGLSWNVDGSTGTPQSQNWNTLDSSPNTANPIVAKNQTSVRTAMAQDQIGTILYTELISKDNAQGSIVNQNPYIQNANEFLSLSGGIGINDFHNGYANYLLLDGHAEAIQPNATLGTTNTTISVMSGMWTIKVND
jgi:prepilin-type processing-associated H-X9-DG protein